MKSVFWDSNAASFIVVCTWQIAEKLLLGLCVMGMVRGLQHIHQPFVILENVVDAVCDESCKAEMMLIIDTRLLDTEPLVITIQKNKTSN